VEGDPNYRKEVIESKRLQQRRTASAETNAGRCCGEKTSQTFATAQQPKGGIPLKEKAFSLAWRESKGK